MNFKFFGKIKENKKSKNTEMLALFMMDGKYGILDSDLQNLLSNLQEKNKNADFKDINLETEFEIKRFVDGTEQTIPITITRNQIEEFVSYIEKIGKKYRLLYAQNTIENIYKTLLTIQFFLPEGEDKNFVKKQIDRLKKYNKKEEKLEPITKAINMITEEIAERNEKNTAEKSNELFINIIANIDKLSNNINDFNDLIKKISTKPNDLPDDQEKISESLILTFEKCFNVISISIKNNLIDSEIYTNTEYIKVIEKFINIIPEKEREEFIEFLNTIKRKTNELKNPMDEIMKNKTKIINASNTYNESYNSSPESKETGTKQGSDNTSNIYDESCNSSPRSEKTDTKQVKQEISTSSIIKSKDKYYLYAEKKGTTIKIEFDSSESKQDFKKKFSYLKQKQKHNRLNKMLSQDTNLLETLEITCNGKTYKGKGDVWNIKNYSNTKSKQTKNSRSR